MLADKKSNSCGLQLADLIARPIGRYVLNPEQENRAYSIIVKKFYCNEKGKKKGGYQMLPLESERPRYSPRPDADWDSPIHLNKF